MFQDPTVYNCNMQVLERGLDHLGVIVGTIILVLM